MGFADQSHMIAEFRRFSSLTPQALADGDWFYPERRIASAIAFCDFVTCDLSLVT
jgi:hypothetical protein